MAWFTYKCEQDGTFRKSLIKREKRQKCPTCDSDCPIVLKPASMQSVEILDNGAMARSVERLVNIEEIMEERADKHSEEHSRKEEYD